MYLQLSLIHIQMCIRDRPKTEIDYLVDHYLSKHDIHLENALSELSSAEQFTTFTEENPFKDMLTKSRELMLLVKNPEKATIQMCIRDRT